MKKVTFMLVFMALMASASAQNNPPSTTAISVAELATMQEKLKTQQESLELLQGRYDNEVRALKLEFKELEGGMDRHLFFLLGAVLAGIGGLFVLRSNVLKQFRKGIEEKAEEKVQQLLPLAVEARLKDEMEKQLPVMVEEVILVNATKFRDMLENHEVDQDIKANAKLLVVARKQMTANLLQKQLVEKHGFLKENVKACPFPIPDKFNGQIWDRIIFEGRDQGLTPVDVAPVISRPGAQKYMYFGSGRFEDYHQYAHKLMIANFPDTFYPNLMKALRASHSSKK